ncbi:hypothetical protein [Niabella hibiscisoli]|uniref:hypothetical protein n=1 Tax=Niabella hibiscisoli TaxID=1825928 RepID=UPI001F0D68A2|nr:hypothetical protein [Niabella hibiscisoli]MCH5721113.1 hypothetical protein [Niabella hibiscisoli]
MNNLIQYLPSGSLLIGLLIVYLLDLVFGVIRASLKGLRRTSRGFRKSIIKLSQYGGCMIVSIVILNIVYASHDGFGRQFAWFFWRWHAIPDDIL